MFQSTLFNNLSFIVALLISTHVYGQDITFKGNIKTKAPLRKSYFREKSESEWVQVKASYLYVNIKAYKLGGHHNHSASSGAEQKLLIIPFKKPESPFRKADYRKNGIIC